MLYAHILILKNSLNTKYKIIYEACYVLSFSKKYDFQSQFFENYDHDYKIKQLKTFFENFNRAKGSIIKIAPQRYQFQSNYQEYSFLKKNYPTIVEDRENLFKSKILIFESFSTAIFETRFSNIPFIIITNISNHFLSTEGKKIIQMFDEKFFRMWEFYLAGCEMAFKWGDQVVYQFQLTKNYTSTPVTRDYIYQ